MKDYTSESIVCLVQKVSVGRWRQRYFRFSIDDLRLIIKIATLGITSLGRWGVNKYNPQQCWGLNIFEIAAASQ